MGILAAPLFTLIDNGGGGVRFFSGDITIVGIREGVGVGVGVLGGIERRGIILKPGADPEIEECLAGGVIEDDVEEAIPV